MNCKRHLFAPEVLRQLHPLRELDNWHAALALIEDWSVIALAVCMPRLAAHSVPSSVGPVMWWVVYGAMSVPLVGIRQRALATLLHESAHKSLARKNLWNFIAGTLLSGYLIFQSWFAYQRSHVRGHHGDFNGPRDVDLMFLRDQGAYRHQPRWRFVWRFLVAPLLMFRTPAKIIDLLRYRFVSKDEPNWERVLKAAYLVILTIMAVRLGTLSSVVLFWLVPLVTAFPVVNWYIELSEHFPLMRDGVTDIHMSRNRWTGAFGKLLTGIHNENFHQVHHLFMTIPFWNMRRAHDILLQDPVYRATQQREVGLLFPIISSVPSILGNIARYHQEEQE